MGSLFRGDGLAADGNVPGILPYVILTFAGIVGLLLPFLELTGQGMPKLAMVRPRPEAATRAAGGGHTRSDARRCLAARAQNFRVRAPHLPSRAVAKRPVEGVHFDAGVLHGEVRRLRTRPVSAMPPVVVAAGGAPQAAFPPRPTTPRRGDRLGALVLTRSRAQSRTLGSSDALKYVIEFTDFFCEHCQEAHHTTMAPLIEGRALKEGKLRIESHPLAYLGEERCARPRPGPLSPARRPQGTS